MMKRRQTVLSVLGLSLGLNLFFAIWSSTWVNYMNAGPVCRKHGDFHIVQGKLVSSPRGVFADKDGIRSIIEPNGRIRWRVYDVTFDYLGDLWNFSNKAAQTEALKATGVNYYAPMCQQKRIGDRTVNMECEFMAKWLIEPVGKPKKLDCGGGKCRVLSVQKTAARNRIVGVAEILKRQGLLDTIEPANYADRHGPDKGRGDRQSLHSVAASSEETIATGAHR